MIRLRHIEIFYAVMIHGSVSGAARMLNLAQPAATRLLQHAELHWGFPLFERIKNRLVPTPAARQLFPEVERAYQQLSVIRTQVAHLRQHSRQHIRVAAPHALSHSLMPKVIEHLRASFPNAFPEVHTLRSHTIVEQVLDQRIELGVVYLAIDNPALSISTLANNPLYAVCPRTWDLPTGTTLEILNALARKPMVYFPSEDPAGHVITTWLQSLDIEVIPSVSVHNLQTGLGMVACGLGWSILDHTVLYGTNVRLSDIHIITLPEAPSLTIHLVHRRDLTASPLIQCFTNGIHTWIKNTFPAPSLA